MNLKTRFLIISTWIIQFTFSNIAIASSNNNFFISPGIRIGLNFNGGLTFGCQFSFGRYFESESENGIHSYFITVGAKSFISKRERSSLPPYFFLKFEATCQPFLPSNAILLLGGAGVALHRKGDMSLSPLMTLSTGFLILPSFDIMLKKKKINIDLGLLCLFPISFDDNLFVVKMQ